MLTREWAGPRWILSDPSGPSTPAPFLKAIVTGELAHSVSELKNKAFWGNALPGERNEQILLLIIDSKWVMVLGCSNLPGLPVKTDGISVSLCVRSIISNRDVRCR